MADTALLPVVVGIDLVRVSETQRSLHDFGERFLKRVSTEAELADCSAGRAKRTERLLWATRATTRPRQWLR